MTTTPMTVRALAERIRPVVEGDHRVLFIYLFGSAARGDAHADSDVDLAVYLAGDVTLLDEARLHEHLARAVGHEVDVVMLPRAPLWLQFRILGEGTVVFTRDEPARIAFRERAEQAFLDFRPYHEAYLAAVRDRARRGALSGG